MRQIEKVLLFISLYLLFLLAYVLFAGPCFLALWLNNPYYLLLYFLLLPVISVHDVMKDKL
jgi:hypothetical protein